jgi:hypothetical protein
MARNSPQQLFIAMKPRNHKTSHHIPKVSGRFFHQLVLLDVTRAAELHQAILLQTNGLSLKNRTTSSFEDTAFSNLHGWTQLSYHDFGHDAQQLAV